MSDVAVAPAGARRGRLSLAARLVALFAIGTSLLLLALGAGLAWMVRVQIDARDREEIDGKTAAVMHLLRELKTGAGIEKSAARFAYIAIGHPHLQIGLREGERWLVRPADEIVALVGPDGNDNIPHLPGIGTYRIDAELWWLRRIDFVTAGDRTFVAYVGVHVTPAQELLERIIGSMLIAGVLGVTASAALGWFIARRGLAPIRAIAQEAERVTAHRLSEPLRVEDAPAEVRGLIVSINRMLARLQGSFRMLEEFSADIAHDLRTPISTLMLQTQVTLSRERSVAEYQETLHSNLIELERLQRMVSDMLFLARADRGMVQIERETVDLAQEARSVAEFFEPVAAEQSQRIEVRGTGLAACDRAMARRALTNLLSNAVRYAPRGATITVDIAAQPDGGAVVDVINPAPPMSAEELQRLFARFARGVSAAAAGAASSFGEGAGLGLSIVNSIMRLHGGSVTADSTPSGLRLRLVFPTAPSDVTQT